jgi:hypothetical protein
MADRPRSEELHEDCCEPCRYRSTQRGLHRLTPRGDCRRDTTHQGLCQSDTGPLCFLKTTTPVLAARDLFSIELFVKGKLVPCMVLFAIERSIHKMELLGVHAQPNGPWMEQIARNVSGEGGFLTGKKYLIHDPDPLYTDKFDSILKATVKLPPRS